MSGSTLCLLFSCSAEDLGWQEDARMTTELRQEIDALHGAIVADLAERLSEQPSFRVVIYETRDSRIESTPLLSARVERRDQAPGLLGKRIHDALKENAEQGKTQSTVVFLARNPLYPQHLLARGIELLGQEDDVIVISEGGQERHNPSLLWIAMKRYHPEVVEPNDRWWQGGTALLQSIADANALVMSVRSVRNITSVDDLGYLFHEIEREVLLKQWYPLRTYEVLHRLRREHLIPEVTE